MNHLWLLHSRLRRPLTALPVLLRRGKYADIPLVSESVYMQVEQSEHM